ncbi:MAG: S-methyl-5'-thioadenosine phosphorylase [Gloeocapsa sp. DLM2.Bin57]|nr:MAG: S-methyl-5'-thioadenosine phosphorylase [Gloeocapsa sp. DLM2.Bin57]
MTTAKIGIIGGSGLYNMEAFTNTQEFEIDTPFGYPSDHIIVGTLAQTQVAFLPRHGRNHHLIPSQLPFRANIYAMKQLGVEYLISASAVGSLREEIKPLDLVIPSQFIDRTTQRVSTFFDDGIVAHIAFADPVCPKLAAILTEAATSLELSNLTVHSGGTYLCIEGPAFSTKAESNLYRSWDTSVIGMTNLPEAKLAREAEIAYATLALVTDYDCWHPEHDSVTVDLVVENLHQNAINAQKVIRETVKRLRDNPPVSAAHSALKNAILTPLDQVTAAKRAKVALLINKYSS